MCFRTRTKQFEKAQRYEMKKITGGKKADLSELLQFTIPKILKRKNFVVPRDRTINIRCTVGIDGSGLVQSPKSKQSFLRTNLLKTSDMCRIPKLIWYENLSLQIWPKSRFLQFLTWLFRFLPLYKLAFLKLDYFGILRSYSIYNGKNNVRGSRNRVFGELKLNFS